MGPAESASTLNVAFIDRSTEEPYDLIVTETFPVELRRPHPAESNVYLLQNLLQ